MNEKAIQNIYNSLFKWEGKRALAPYPIHKKLTSENFGYSDIYQWIAEIYTYDSNAQILDAGCGVGYGSIYLSKQWNCNVKGISLSDAEINKASEFIKNENLKNKVIFKQQSYDDLIPKSFDFIIAIESVKHSLDINKTLSSLKNALKPNGILLIVDDFLISETNSYLVKKYSRDWKLKVILKHHSFASDFTLKKDLTPFVNTKSHALLNTSIFALSLLSPILKIAPIMRGGLYLEQLFKKNIMKYYALEFKSI